MRNLLDPEVSIKPAATKRRLSGNTSIAWELEGCTLPHNHPMYPADWKFEVSADVSLGDPGSRSGHPDTWYPPEGAECDIVDVMLYIDPDNILTPDVIENVERMFRQLIANDRKLSERIEEALFEQAGENTGNRRRRFRRV
jgi:hypothetical protein